MSETRPLAHQHRTLVEEAPVADLLLQRVRERAEENLHLHRLRRPAAAAAAAHDPNRARCNRLADHRHHHVLLKVDQPERGAQPLEAGQTRARLRHRRQPPVDPRRQPLRLRVELARALPLVARLFRCFVAEVAAEAPARLQREGREV